MMAPTIEKKNKIQNKPTTFKKNIVLLEQMVAQISWHEHQTKQIIYNWNKNNERRPKNLQEEKQTASLLRFRKAILLSFIVE